MPKHQDPLQTLTPPKVLPSGHGPAYNLIYDATFSDGSLNPDVDVLNIGPLQFGDSVQDNPSPGFTFANGELVLSVNLPLPKAMYGQMIPAVTAGVFATSAPLPSLVTHEPFMLQGTYVAPSGPTEGAWAVGILARSGGVEDYAANTQVVATLQFNASETTGTARLNLPKGATTHTAVPLPTAVYNEIINNQTPFTLRLFVDRSSSMGSAYLTVGQPPVAKLQREHLQTNSGLVQTFSIPNFPLADFQENSPWSITAVGTVIANASAYGETVSVHVRDFGISVAPYIR